MKRVGTWRAFIVLAVGGLAASTCLAQSTTDCSSVADDKRRLQCYDDQAHHGKKAAAAASAADSAAITAPATAAAPSAQPAPASVKPGADSSDFGLGAEALRKKRGSDDPQASKESQQIVARVKEVSTKAHGEFRITLEDGQVWEETQHTGGLPPAAGESVTIKRGALGSYFLARKSGLALRVKRVQ